MQYKHLTVYDDFIKNGYNKSNGIRAIALTITSIPPPAVQIRGRVL